MLNSSILKNILKPFAFILLLIYCGGCTKIDNDLQLGTASDESLAKSNKSKPNIIIILIDDNGYEVPQYTGGQSYSTPEMNLLAASGMQFTHCYASAMCSPSRITLMTGKYGFRNYHDWGIMDTTQKTIANMLHDNGYATCVSGKWQLDGNFGKFGFDEYSVFDPFQEPDSSDGDENEHRYKNPTIYQNGSYLPDSKTNGKYSDDLFADYATKFIDRNKSKNFFLYFSFSECHIPFSPPPNNPDFATYDPLTTKSNPKYFPDMVSYMDSKINTIITKVTDDALLSNTVIFILADNGTSEQIVSKYNGRNITGGKKHTNEFGNHVPLIVIGPGLKPGSINKNIIDFTDFLPTIANIAQVPKNKLGSYGILDGQSFLNQLKTPTAKGRDWSYGYYYPYPFNVAQKRIYVQDTTYKLYDITDNNNFYNMQVDSLEQFPIPDTQLTPSEQKVKSNFQAVLASMHN